MTPEIEALLLPSSNEQTDSLYDETKYERSHELLTRDIEAPPDIETPIWAQNGIDSVDFEHADDGVAYYQQLPLTARTVYVLSLSTTPFTLTLDNRRSITIPIGFIGAFPVPAIRGYKIQANTALGNGTLILTWYRERFKPQLVATTNLGGAAQPIGAVGVSPTSVTGLAGPAATLLVPARLTRTGCTIVNTDLASNIALGTSNAVLYAGASSFKAIGPGSSFTFTFRGTVWFIADSGTPIIGVWDEAN